MLHINTASHFPSSFLQFPPHSSWDVATTQQQHLHVAEAAQQLGRPSVADVRVNIEVKLPHLWIKQNLICKSTLANSISRSLLSHPASPSIITCLFLNDVIIAIKLTKSKCFNINKICLWCLVYSCISPNKQISINYFMTAGKNKRGNWVNKHG